MKGEFILPDPKFSSAAIECTKIVLASMKLAVKPEPVPETIAHKMFAASGQYPFEQLTAAMQPQSKHPGFREVAAYIASARPSPGETDLSLQRTGAVLAGLQKIAMRPHRAPRMRRQTSAAHDLPQVQRAAALAPVV